MKNKYNIGDILTNESNTVEFIVVEITGEHETIRYNSNSSVHIIREIRYKLVSNEDTLYVTQEIINNLLKLKENNN